MISEKTQHQIESPIEKYAWILYFLIAFLSSLIGDIFILVASVGYNALKLNRYVVVIIQHIAVCDLLRSTVFVLPTTVSLLANGWIFGQTLGYIIFFLNIFSFQVSNMLICVLTTTKILLLKYPARTAHWLKRRVHVMCGVVWVVSLWYPALRLADNQTICFDYSVYHIFLGVSSVWIIVITKAALVMTVLLPILLVVATTSATSCYLVKSRRVSRRSGGRRQWHGMVTVMVTAVVYCISIVPLWVVLVAFLFNINIASDADQATLRRITEFLTTLNVVSNFYIYCLTVPSFRCFLRTKVYSVSATLDHISSLGRVRVISTNQSA